MSYRLGTVATSALAVALTTRLDLIHIIFFDEFISCFYFIWNMVIRYSSKRFYIQTWEYSTACCFFLSIHSFFWFIRCRRSGLGIAIESKMTDTLWPKKKGEVDYHVFSFADPHYFQYGSGSGSNLAKCRSGSRVLMRPKNRKTFLLEKKKFRPKNCNLLILEDVQATGETLSPQKRTCSI